MRNELENIELIEKYLNGELSMKEKQIVENQIQNDTEFKQQFEAQKLLQKAIQRAALRKEIKTISQSGGGNSNFTK